MLNLTTAARLRRASARAFSFAVLAVASLGLGGGCQSAPSPAAEFVQQAERLHTESLQTAVAGDTELNEYFGLLGMRVVAGATAADPTKTKDPVFAAMRFHLVGSESVNAVPTGGRHIYVYSGLMQACESEDELAAVMAHEFAHAVSLDLQKTGMKPDARASLDRTAYQFVSFPMPGDVESPADALAFTFYVRGGWDPLKFADVYEHLKARGLDGPPAPPANRPSLASRAAAVRALVAALPASERKWRQATVADAESFKALRAKALIGGERASPLNRAYLYLRGFPCCLTPADPPEGRAAQAQLLHDLTPPSGPAGGKEPS